jgi:hypothetical protein
MPRHTRGLAQVLGEEIATSKTPADRLGQSFHLLQDIRNHLSIPGVQDNGVISIPR